MTSPERLRVALIQNRVQPGGRFQVMAEMIKVLNTMGIVPDILSFRFRIPDADIKKYYGQELEFNLHLVKPEPPLPFEWNIWWFNRKISRKLGNYDLVINHNNTSFGLHTDTQVLSYIHFPRKFRMLSNLKDIHWPEKTGRPLVNFNKDFLNLLRWYYGFDQKFNKKEKLLANSEYSARCTLEVYPRLNKTDVQVLYPPIDIKINTPVSGRQKRVVSLGRISPQKRQWEQIGIAARLPKLEFVIMGFVADQSYYERCLQRIKNEALTNVRILSNADQKDVEAMLHSSSFFIHSMRNEPFGITSVQAIANACLPIVHDSGGQREVVFLDELRYTTPEEAVLRIEELLKLSETDLMEKSRLLQEHILLYDSEVFRSKFRNLFENLTA